MSWSCSRDRWSNYKRSCSSGRLTWKERDVWSIWTKPKPWWLGLGLDKVQNLAKTPAPRASQTPFSVGFIPVGSTRDTEVSGSLKHDPSFRCDRYTGQASAVDSNPMPEVTVIREKHEVVSSFCDLRECLSLGSVCEVTSITGCRVHVANSMNSCPSQPPAHFPSPPEDEFTICQERRALCKGNCYEVRILQSHITITFIQSQGHKDLKNQHLL